MSKFSDTCWECRHLCSSPNWRNDDVNGSRRKIRCDALHYDVDPYDRKCCRFDNGHYSDDFIQRCVDAFYKKCNYYIVSACVGISNPDNADELLDSFKNVSTEGIQSDIVMHALSRLGLTPEGLLANYETYGKRAADMLYAAYENPESREATKAYVDTEILPRLNELKERLDKGRLTGVVIGYTCLMERILKKLGIKYEKQQEVQEEMDIPNLDTPAFGTR